MDKVEKFKELLKEYEEYLWDSYVNRRDDYAFNGGMLNCKRNILKMYEEAINEQESKSL